MLNGKIIIKRKVRSIVNEVLFENINSDNWLNPGWNTEYNKIIIDNIKLNTINVVWRYG